MDVARVSSHLKQRLSDVRGSAKDELMEKRLLQIVVGLVGLIPVAAGLAGVLAGAAMLGLWGGPILDSHFRYLSGLLLGIGLAYWAAIPNIEKNGQTFGLLTLIVVIGGAARAFGALRLGLPGGAMTAALGVELIVTPLIYLWQGRVARLAQAAGRG
jgi:hypothetical protein